jgi:hypothetical protein
MINDLRFTMYNYDSQHPVSEIWNQASSIALQIPDNLLTGLAVLKIIGLRLLRC